MKIFLLDIYWRCDRGEAAKDTLAFAATRSFFDTEDSLFEFVPSAYVLTHNTFSFSSRVYPFLDDLTYSEPSNPCHKPSETWLWASKWKSQVQLLQDPGIWVTTLRSLLSRWNQIMFGQLVASKPLLSFWLGSLTTWSCVDAIHCFYLLSPSSKLIYQDLGSDQYCRFCEY